MRISLGLGLTFSILAWTITAHALKPPYLDEMPEISRVLADMQGKNQADTLARHAAALVQLTRIVYRMAGKRVDEDALTSDEVRLATAYGQESGRIERAVYSDLNPTNEPVSKDFSQWRNRFKQYRDSDDFMAEILHKYLSPGSIETYKNTFAETSAWQTKQVKAPPILDFGSGPEVGSERWNNLRPDQIAFVIGTSLIMILLLGLVLAADFLLPFDIDPKDPHKIRSGLRRFRIDWVTGTLSDLNTRTETATSSNLQDSTPLEVSHGAGPNKWVTATHSTLYEEFSLIGENSQYGITVPKSVSRGFESGYFRDKVGREISYAWVTRANGKFIGHLLFYDWIPNMAIAEGATDGTIGKLRSAKSWSAIPALILGFVIGMAVDAPLARLWMPIVVLIIWVAVHRTIGSIREDHFRRTLVLRLLPHIRA